MEHPADSILRRLSVMTYANGYTHWHYKAHAADTVEAITAPGFFADLEHLVADADTVMISCPRFAFQGVFFRGETIRVALTGIVARREV